jgi:hypothetical protein
MLMAAPSLWVGAIANHTQRIIFSYVATAPTHRLALPLETILHSGRRNAANAPAGMFFSIIHPFQHFYLWIDLLIGINYRKKHDIHSKLFRCLADVVYFCYSTNY